MPEQYVNVYDQVGEREDLIDVITNISPEDTVILSALGRTDAKSFKHDWLTEALQASNSGNAIIDGASATFASGDYNVRVLVSNYTQILRKPFSASYSQEAIVQAGISSEFEHQRELKTVEIARDLNAALINQTSASGTSAAARRMNGVLASTTTNVIGGEGNPVTQKEFNRLLQTIWQAGGRPGTVFCGGGNKRTISDWGQPQGNRNVDASGHKIIARVDTYDSDFGIVEIMPEREMPTDQIAVMELKRWRVAYLRPLFFEEMGAVGEQKRGTVVSEATLEYLAENSSGKITNVPPAN